MARRNYWPLLALLALATLPLALAMLSYFGGIGVPVGRVNQGQLVLTPTAVASWQLRVSDGEPWQGQGRWQLLLVVERCEDGCLAWQYTLGQLHKALGRDRQRVERQLVLPRAAAEGVTANGVIANKAVFVSAGVAASNQGIWLVDPLGNLVLRYRLDQPPQALFKDLKRLLKVSNVG
ncbi:MAG: hypothetical protein V7629_05995 [Motiliproteus sp.]